MARPTGPEWEALDAALTAALAPHDPTEPAGQPGDRRTITDGPHRITQLRTADGWWNIEVR